MRINFIGCPCSGKTTTAAMIFSLLKEMGIGCEFITEQARLYIAKLKFSLTEGQVFRLVDEDQISIMRSQIHVEEVMSSSLGEEGVLISDSSALSALLYMTPEMRKRPEVQCVKQRAIEMSDLVFYAPPVEWPSFPDPNRAHSVEESRKIDQAIEGVLREEAPGVFEKMISLPDGTQERQGKVIGEIMRRRFS